MDRDLRRSEEHYRLLFETMLQGVVYQDADGKIISMNPAAERILGKSPKEFLGNTSVSVEHHTIREDGTMFPGLEHPSMVALQTGREVRDVVMGVFNPREQGYRWINITAVPLFREGEVKPHQVYTLFADITDHSLAKAAMARLASIVEFSNDAIIGRTLDGIITDWNPAAERLFGYSAGEAVGKPLSILFPPDRSHELEEILRRTSAGERIENLETVRVCKDGKRLDVSLTVSPIKNSSGRVVGVSAIARDITSRKRAEQERERLLVEAERRAAEMAALQEWLQDVIRTVSHDLRNPLTVIRVQAQFLMGMIEKPGLEDAKRQSAEAIITGANRMNAMIEDLIQSMHLEAGHVRLDKRPVDLKQFVTDLLSRTTGVMDVRRVQVQIPADLPPTPTDPDRLERIFINLISNALKYSPPQKAVLIKATRRPTDVIVCITDRGVGIAREDLPRIFDRFYRSKTGRGFQGLGLGLYITKMLVEAHGGEISVESDEGNGSTFYFTIPLRDI